MLLLYFIPISQKAVQKGGGLLSEVSAILSALLSENRCQDFWLFEPILIWNEHALANFGDLCDLKQTFSKFTQQHAAQDTKEGQARTLNNLPQHSTNTKVTWSSKVISLQSCKNNKATAESSMTSLHPP